VCASVPNTVEGVAISVRTASEEDIHRPFSALCLSRSQGEMAYQVHSASARSISNRAGDWSNLSGQ
jgi:hypothetical protein